RLPKSVQPWQNCPEPVRLVSASLQFSTRSNENLLVVATEDWGRHRCQICPTPPSTHRSMPVTKELSSDARKTAACAVSPPAIPAVQAGWPRAIAPWMRPQPFSQGRPPAEDRLK